MTSSPDLIKELRAARPSAPAALRTRVRELATEPAGSTARPRWRFPLRRGFVVAIPVAAALAIVSAGALGLARSDAPPKSMAATVDEGAAPLATLAPARAQQVAATLTVEVKDSNGVSRASQDALDLTRSLGGYVVSSSVTTGEQGGAAIVVRIPV